MQVAKLGEAEQLSEQVVGKSQYPDRQQPGKTAAHLGCLGRAGGHFGHGRGPPPNLIWRRLHLPRLAGSQCDVGCARSPLRGNISAGWILCLLIDIELTSSLTTHTIRE